MVVPVDPDEREAQHVHEQAGQLRAYRHEGGALRGAKVERHDRDDDGHHGVAERLDAARAQLQRPDRPMLVAHGAMIGPPPSGWTRQRVWRASPRGSSS